MNYNTLERIISKERLSPYLAKHTGNWEIDKIQDARKTILKEKRQITPGKLVAELTFGFWTSLFDTRFERILWKDLRLAFPRCPKKDRQRRNVSSKLNSIRKLRNRIFHHESIAWSYKALVTYKNEILEGIDWLNGDLAEYFSDTIRINDVLKNQKGNIEY